MNILLAASLLLCAVAVVPLRAGEAFVYQDGDTRLAGYLAAPARAQGRVPGVVVLHAWMGLGDHERATADALARLGYIALAADVYGENVRPKSTDEAGALAGRYKQNRALYRRRIQAALDALKAQPLCDPDRVAVIGYCFGGTGALEAARAGMPVRGVVSFHGGLEPPLDVQTLMPIRAKILVCHGAEDTLVPPQQVEAFQNEMRRAKADWQMIYYANARHAFTDPAAGDNPAQPTGYNPAAARRSWEHMLLFLKEIFSERG